MFQKLLEYKGHDATLASSGADAVGLVRERDFGMVFLDVVMPGCNGIETLRELKALKPNLVVVMMTAFTVERELRKAIELGAFDFLYKPFDINEVTAAIRKAQKKDSLKPVPGPAAAGGTA